MNKKLKDFRDLMFNSLGKYCVNPFCTTCGSLDFKDALDKFTRDEIIEGLKSLPEEYLDLRDSEDALLTCFCKASLFGTGRDLIELLKGTPAGKELELILKHEKDHKTYLRNLELQANEQRYKRVLMLRERAKKHIWGAVNRKDTKAIEIMISRGID
jgi:hypothetical protein